MKLCGLRALASALALLAVSATAAADTWTDYADIGPDLLAYETAYPTICERHDLGLSVQGRHLWAIRISDNIGVEEDEPEFKYIATMHGNEIVGTKMCMMLIDYLLTNYGSDTQVNNIINETDLWIVPLMNPDGYILGRRENYNYVDLNRHFPEGSGSSPEPNTTSGREPEIAVIMNWSFGESFVCSANFHGGALVANYPFDNDDMGSVFSPTPDEDLFVWMSLEYTQHNLTMYNSPSFQPYGITNGAEWYSIDGGMQDWSYRYMGCNEITFELGNTKSPPASDIGDYWSDNRDAMLAYIETCLVGVRGVVTEYGTGLPLDATVSIVGRDHDVFTDPDVGDYHRMVEPGTYDLVFETAGYDPLTFTNVVVMSGDATRLDVVFGEPDTEVASPDGGEQLGAGVPTTVTWTGPSTREFQVQYTENYGDISTPIDDFERSTLGVNYKTDGDADWFITTGTYHSATRSARAGDIDNDQDTWMARDVDGGDVSFWYRVSSESGYDFFNFYINGDRKLHVSGSGSWTQYSTTLPAGTYELKWEYTKDWSEFSGSDTVWIDDLQVTEDNTAWTDIVSLTAPGATSAPWTPVNPGSDYKVRVRAYYGGGVYSGWDESDDVFAVVPVDADGDYDGDGDVDLADFAALQGCFGQSAGGACGEAFEFVVDGTIDLADFEMFAGEMTGP